MAFDLHDRLEHLAGPAAAPGPDTVEADLARARTALRRNRFTRIAGASGVAALVLTAALVVPGLHGSGPAAPPAGGGAATVHLVAYEGTQPAGFTIDQVPQGWEVQGVDRDGLTLAPVGIADRDPHSFEGKITILAERSVPDGVGKQSVTVQGRPAVLAVMKGDTKPSTLFVKQDNGVYLVIQVWPTLGWTGTDIVSFGNGIHMEPGALTTAG
ncbi:hypothetical protein Dvina_39235 [Dactylosporangium vinaceum]|uniref:Uncharacterized protein n=1 Tax=Dactylosporangium vinaceum TaxID=53362 RepID=A0ABV5MKJ9_9ACTN|nr:hypothetical protein [Dactylosporangium vinaceum]UAB94173.1 hypothetical protein Dvina_39235 [Dactylosporangium vinaceum]